MRLSNALTAILGLCMALAANSAPVAEPNDDLSLHAAKRAEDAPTLYAYIAADNEAEVKRRAEDTAEYAYFALDSDAEVKRRAEDATAEYGYIAVDSEVEEEH
ncbi:hypothetical protein DTO169E5_9026 [Paecilomyces variotii]|nr:hypothetical protein DTO169E5_9026 [Paecilomyces variotii]